MARTRSRRTRASRSRRRAMRPLPDILTAARWILRPEVVGALLVVLAAAAVPYLLPLVGVFGDARDALVRALGLHVFTLTALLAVAGVLVAFRRAGRVARHRRHLLGALSLLVFAAGALGGWRPAAEIGSVDLAETSAGGQLGSAVLAWPWAVAWLAALPLGFALLWPHTSIVVLRASPGAARRSLRAAWRLGLHRRIARAARAARALLRRRRATPPADVRQAIADWRPAQPVEELAGPPTPSLAAATATAGEAAAPPADPNARSEKQIPMDMEHAAEEWRHSADGWQLPPMDLLDEGTAAGRPEIDNEQRAQLIVKALASFGVDARVTEINEGPTVTQFGVEPGWDVRTRRVQERDASGQPVRDEHGQPKSNEIEVSRTRIRVNRITALQNDLALALAAPALRIEAPVPGKPMVGIEVPNTSATIVTLRAVMEAPSFRQLQDKAALPIALGSGVSGEAVAADLASMPHLLIAGATGSGKSVCLNSIIIGLLMNYSPEELRLVLIDPKRVELTLYRSVPHLAFSEIVVDMDRIVGTLQAVTNEMDSRYRRFAKVGARDIGRYNEKAIEGQFSKLPYWVVVVDELADLMLSAPFQVEKQVVRLAQLARATGIHLIIATQRPSVDVVTGLIKANFPTRVAFAMASQVDSRTVIDMAGAEKLLGRGDMLYMPTDAQKPKRLQGVYLSDHEIEAVTAFWTDGRFSKLVPDKHDEQLREAVEQVVEAQTGEAEEETDPNVQKAIELARESKTLSTSMLQRRLRIGYPRAARIMDELEAHGVIGPPEVGGSSRKVLLHAEPVAPALDGTARDDL